MRGRLRLRIRYAAPVIILILFGHVSVLYGVVFSRNVNAPDVDVFDGTAWSKIKFSVLCFYFSRLATMLLWYLRLVWRLATASDEDSTLIRGVVGYGNCFAKAGRTRSRQLLTSSKRHLRSPRISPTREGPTLSSIPNS
ncbi:unnamed protein product [Phytophthora lilii]|uniref:Unnamed protein product n=1 Tax=Phytophthora lilii TaxID=2077276 RepID=A0A9W6U9D5_9STRA|nr:unnamed protein product [Phytophthora lilii]